MAIAVAVGVGLLAALVQSQFQFNIVLCIAQVDEPEVRKIERMRGREVQYLAVKLQRRVQVAHADHRMDELGHVSVGSL